MHGLAASRALAPAARALRALPANPDVVVIGAAAAGIAAARRPMAVGLEVAVIEAAGRPGGRAWTDSTALGQPFDRGASWLQGPADLPHFARARDAGYHLHPHSSARDVCFVGDRRADPNRRGLRDRARAAVHDAPARAPGDVPAASVLPDMPFAGGVATWIGPTDVATDFDRRSTADRASCADHQVNHPVREGHGTPVARHGTRLPVKISTPARAIDWSGPGMRVETDAGTISARACIVAVSTGVLAAGGLRFAPDLPAAPQTASADRPMGQLLKIGRMVDGARLGLPPGDVTSQAIDGTLPAETCHFRACPTGHEPVVGFAGGSFGRALEAGAEAAAIAFALERFAAMPGGDDRRTSAAA